MFGTIFLMRPKPGQENAVVALFDKWDRERRPKIKGALAGHLYRNVQDPAELMAAVVFDSRDSYFANANDTEQGPLVSRAGGPAGGGAPLHRRRSAAQLDGVTSHHERPHAIAAGEIAPRFTLPDESGRSVGLPVAERLTVPIFYRRRLVTVF